MFDYASIVAVERALNFDKNKQTSIDYFKFTFQSRPVVSTVSIKLGSKLLPFSDAFVSAETNGSCGVGQLIYDSSDFFRVEQAHTDCPLLLTTNRKSVMQRLPPLRWKAPLCGCVHFR